ncbi:MAG TPA: NAD(P)-binding domain-containing protein, partial [Jatrophihabitans sp.]|nr:NAD(P)-binding domain-containing protein [Jatrophihabitans sp.]
MKTAVLGAGNWGTAFAKVLVDSGTETVLWARRPELAEVISREHVNPDYLDGLPLPPSLRATADPAEALDRAELVVLAVPSQTLRANLTGWVDLLPAEATLVSLMKGIELGTVKRMSEVISEVAGA